MNRFLSSSAGSIFTKRTLGIFVIMLTAFALALYGMGRLPIAESGLGLWTSNAWSTDTSQLLGDPYSFSHVLHGVIFYAILRRLFKDRPVHQLLLFAVLIEMSWELLENTPLVINRYRSATASLDYFGDSVINSVGDVLFTIFGFWFTQRFRWYLSLAFFVVIEMLMLALIRDNLTLNVVMLIAPIDAVRVWQAAR